MREKPSLSKMEYEQRFLNVQAKMVEQGLDGLIAFSGYQEREGHVAYLTNFHNSFPNAMSHLGFGHAAVIVSAKGGKALVAPFGYEDEKIFALDRAYFGDSLVRDLVKAIKDLGLEAGRLGVAGMDVIPAEYYLQLLKDLPGASIEKADLILESLRLIKSPAEIEMLRMAAHAADAGLNAGLQAIKPGATGHDIEMAARQAASKCGADFVARVRVSSGKAIKNVQWPQVSGSPFQNGDLVFLDLIGWVNGYGFDCSRVAVAGDCTAEQKTYLDLLAEATQWMIDSLKPGRENTFYMAEARGFMIMPMGHGIGLEICETPWISVAKPLTVQPGMVLCIEPVVSSQKFGKAAVENMVVVTEHGVEVLNQLP